jgi:hypothetical protein
MLDERFAEAVEDLGEDVFLAKEVGDGVERVGQYLD